MIRVMKVGPVLVLLLLISYPADSQSHPGKLSGSAQGSLTVTATVESSVWLVMEPDGKQEIFVANAPDPKESFYRPPALKRQQSLQRNAVKKAGLAPGKKAAGAVSPAKPPHEKATVQYNFPQANGPFEVTQETRFVDVNNDGKTARQAVQVITVVAR
jgi:hypothetical protein